MVTKLNGDILATDSIFSKMNKKAKRSCPLNGGQLAFAMR